MLLKVFQKKRDYQENLLLFAMIGMALVFLFITLAYLARKGSADWIDFKMPKLFSFSTFFMLVSSYTLYVANNAFEKQDFFTYKYLLGTTFVLGIFFLLCQYFGWKQLEAQGLFFGKKAGAAANFLYLLSGLHILHLLGGMVALWIVFWKAVKKESYVDDFIHAVNPPTQRRLKLATRFWHFLDILWLYLYVFFYIQH
ncbi:cytochrome c oxidase subunit 3 [Raineya sp.]|jgi:cytochrome c oxidase subunit 3